MYKDVRIASGTLQKVCEAVAAMLGHQMCIACCYMRSCRRKPADLSLQGAGSDSSAWHMQPRDLKPCAAAALLTSAPCRTASSV